MNLSSLLTLRLSQGKKNEYLYFSSKHEHICIVYYNFNSRYILNCKVLLLYYLHSRLFDYNNDVCRMAHVYILANNANIQILSRT